MSLFNTEVLNTLKLLIQWESTHRENLEHVLMEADVRGKIINQAITEFNLSMKHLSTIFTSYQKANDADDEALAANLRRFLTLRWNAIRNTPIAYSDFPASGLNAICHELAILLAKPDEPVARVLMPTLIIDYYMSVDENLMVLTEVSETNRHLAFHKFFVSQDGQSVVPLEAWFSRIDEKTARPYYYHLYRRNKETLTQPLSREAFDHAQKLALPDPKNKDACAQYNRAYADYIKEFKEIKMSPTDRAVLISSGNVFARAYFNEVERQENFEKTFPLTQALDKLCNELEDNGETKQKSDKQGSASNYRAHPDAEKAIHEFFKVWNNATQVQRDSISNLPCVQYHTDFPRTVHSYLLVLRLAVSDPNLTDADRQQLAREDIILCADTIADYLRRIRKANPVVFTGAPADAPTLAALRQNVLEHLANAQSAMITIAPFRDEDLLATNIRQYTSALDNPEPIYFFHDFLSCLGSVPNYLLVGRLLDAPLVIQANILEAALNHDSPKAANVLSDRFRLTNSSAIPRNSLQVAARKGWASVVNSILSRSNAREYDIVDAQGKTAFELALINGHLPAAKMLWTKEIRFSQVKNTFFKSLYYPDDLIKTALFLNPLPGDSGPITYLNNEMEMSQEALIKILGTYVYYPDNDGVYLSRALREFLKLRWELIRNTPGAYVEYSHSPMNSLCYQLALKIALPGESIAQILMPTLTVESYAHFGENLVELTESKTRELRTNRFIISHDGKAIIPLIQWFRFQATEGGDQPWFNHGYKLDRHGEVVLDQETYFKKHPELIILDRYDERSDAPYLAYVASCEPTTSVPLSAEDLQNLKFAASPGSQNYFNEIDFRNNSQTPGSLGDAMELLIKGLFANGQNTNKTTRSKSGDVYKATDDQAHIGVIPCIVHFLKKLRELRPEDRERILALRHPNSSNNLRVYVLNLRWGIQDPMTPEEELAQGMQNTCVESNGNALRIFYNLHKATINGVISTPVPLSGFRDDALRILNQRAAPVINTERFSNSLPLVRVQIDYKNRILALSRKGAFLGFDDFLTRSPLLPPLSLNENLVLTPSALLSTFLHNTLALQAPDSLIIYALVLAIRTQGNNDALEGAFGPREKSLLYVATENNWREVVGILPIAFTELYFAVFHGTLTEDNLADGWLAEVHGESLMHLAIERNHPDTVLLLLQHGADHTQVYQNRTLLHWAITQRHREIAEFLLEKDLSPDFLLFQDLFTLSWPRAMTLALEQLAFDPDFDINRSFDNDSNALLLTVQNNHLEIMINLLQYKTIDVTLALDHLIHNGKVEFLAHFIRSPGFESAFPDLNPQLRHSLFNILITTENDELIRTALDSGILRILGYAGRNLLGQDQNHLAFQKMQHYGLTTSLDELLLNPALDKVTQYYGLNHLCTLAKITPDSLAAFKFHSQVELLRLEYDPEAKGSRSEKKKELLKEGIRSNDAVQGHALMLSAHEMHRSHRSQWASLLFGNKPTSYSKLPDAFKKGFS